jgi:periplasmic protein CpxP/Spy
MGMRALRALRRTLLAALAVAAAAGPAAAQRPDARGEQRATLEQQVRQRIAAVVKERLQLSDAQMRRLEETNRRYDDQRRSLFQREREARGALRDEVTAGERANQDHAAALIDQLLRVQRQRLDLVEQEQRDLAAFLTPVQRAKFLALQDQIRRRVSEMRARREARRMRAGPPE